MTISVQRVRHDIDAHLLAEIRATGAFACDIETSGLNPKTNRIGTVQIFAPQVGSVVLQVDSGKPTNFCRLIEDDSVLKVFHHAMFDLRFMVEHWHVQPATVACTKIASKLLNPTAESSEHSLQCLLSRRLGVSLSKDQRISNWLAADLTDAQIRYAVADVEHLLPLLDVLRDDLRATGLSELFVECVNFIPIRVRLDLGGWPDVFLY